MSWNETFKTILRNALDREYRSSFVQSRARTMLAIQIRTLREQRGITQAKLAEELNTTQSGVSRLEDPEYGRLTVTSLLQIAAVFDVGLIVKFVPHNEFFSTVSDLDRVALEVASFQPEMLDEPRTSTATELSIEMSAKTETEYQHLTAEVIAFRPISKSLPTYRKAS